MNGITSDQTGQLQAVVPCYGSPPPRPQRVPVVVTVEPDGFLRVYAPDHVDVRIVGLLDVLPENRTDAEAYAILRLPVPHKEIAFDARCNRGVFLPSPRTVEEELERVFALSLAPNGFSDPKR